MKSFVNKQGYVFRTNADSITFENHYKEGTEEPVIPETPDTPNTDDKSEISDDVNSTPQTDDSSSIYLWILLISASSLSLGTFVRFTKKSDK